ncbi:MAG: polymorphic toxin type 23 domain-containing protein [Bacteroidia bacterium]|nr:polymorphic toxin type 23 domain-containing protein [Bacteroidia bacterium]
MRKFFKLLFLICISQTLTAQNSVPTMGFLARNYVRNASVIRLYPSLNLGTHINELSANLTMSRGFRIGSGPELRLQWHSSLRGNLNYLGLSGASIGVVNKASVIYSFGAKKFPCMWKPFYWTSRQHNIEYYYIHYASSDGTNQFSGGLIYTLLLRSNLITFKFENDFMAFLGLDEYRTGGGSLDIRRPMMGKMVGIGAGALLWTGSTKGLSNLDFGQEYDMSNQYGADYSHGIVYLNLHYGGLTLSLGFDSEPIRMGIQDNLHKLIDDGTIPGGRLSRNRLFIQLNLYDFEFLY